MSTANEWSAAEIAGYDQALAGTDAELDRLADMLRTGIGEVGERQAMANVGAFLLYRDDPRSLVGLLTGALRRIVGEAKVP